MKMSGMRGAAVLCLLLFLAPATATSRASIQTGSSVFPEYDKEYPVEAPEGVWKVPGPKHTNAWWATIGLGKGNGVFTTLPYANDAQKDGVRACTMTSASSAKAAQFPCASRFQLTWASKAADMRTIVGYDDLSVTVEYPAVGVRFPIVHGQPYLTAAYSNVNEHAPMIKLFNNINSWDADASTVTDVAGQQFVCFTTSATGTWQQSGTNSLVLSGAASSEEQPVWVRVAACGGAYPPCQVLLDYASTIPIGGDASYTVSGRYVQFSFDFKLAKVQPQQNSSLLMMTLLHHRRLMSETSPPSLLSGCAALSPRGTMQCAIGTRWVMSGKLPKESWNPLLDAESCDMQAQIQNQMETVDVFTDDGSQPGDSVYWYSKRLFELARLAAIADEYNMNEERYIFVSRLYTRLVVLLDNSTSPDPDWSIIPSFAYESTWGGVVNHLAPENVNVDFGQGYYNDHHLQYGYVLYAAAVLAKFHPTFVKEYDSHIRDIIRDIANPVADDYFPAFRVFDWYAGHSWATGLFEGDRNQESSSEAVNAWYATWLYGLATASGEIESVGATLLINEVTAAQHYYQINDQDAVYTAPFSNNKVVGVLYGSYALYNTHFGSKPEYINLIQFVPFSPVTEYLIPQTWVNAQYPVLQAAATGSWPELVCMNEAMVNPAAAYENLQALGNDELGSSTRSTLLHWVATRPGWLPTSGRCSETITLDNPTEPYPYCTVLRQLAVGIDSSESYIVLHGNSFLMARTDDDDDVILCAALDNSTHRFLFSQSFQSTSGVADWINTKLEDGDVLVFASLGGALDGATQELLQSDFNAVLASRVNDKTPYVLVAERGGRVFTEERLDKEAALQQITTSIQCDSSVMLTSGCFDVEVFSAGYYDGKGGYIRTNGEFVIPTSLGLNAAIFDKTTMNVKAFGTFNTYASMAQSETMAVWLDTVAESGDVLVLIAQDDAASRLEASLIHTLEEQYAASKIGNLGFRDSYVLISAKNAAKPLHEAHARSGHGNIRFSAPLPCEKRSYESLLKNGGSARVSTVTAVVITLSIFLIQLFV